MKHAELNRQIKKAFLEIESMRFREYPEIYEERSGADIDYSECYVKYINNLLKMALQIVLRSLIRSAAAQKLHVFSGRI